MSHERRQNSRRFALVECAWTRTARITDLSLSGCYVDAVVVPAVGEIVDFDVRLMGQRVTLRGVVVHAKPSVGFALRFENLDEDAAVALSAFMAAPS